MSEYIPTNRTCWICRCSDTSRNPVREVQGRVLVFHECTACTARLTGPETAAARAYNARRAARREAAEVAS